MKKENNNYLDIWFFVFSVLFISIFINWLYAFRHVTIPISAAQFAVGVVAFFLQRLIQRKPLIELYSKVYPYRKLKPYGVISAVVLFEFVLIWGLYSKQILNKGDDLFLIILVFTGAIVYYHLFIRMKVSLRFLSLAIFIPTIAVGASLGLGSYFNMLKFVVPTQKIGDIVFFNTIYWILVNIFIQTICEEPAFRGYLMQRLLGKGELFSILVSSVVFAIWYIPFVIFTRMSCAYISLTFIGNFIMAVIFALLFIKGRNLLVAIICHGIINGYTNSLFASSVNPGIRQYVTFVIPQGETKFLIIWFACLFIGLILITFIPRKKPLN